MAEAACTHLVLRGLKFVTECQEELKKLNAPAQSSPQADHRAWDRLPKGKLYPLADWAPDANIVLPYRTFGDIETVDRGEIDQYWNIQTLIENYREHKQREKPLSIAVFGPPGSGKSTAIKRILEVIGKGAQSAAPLEFNLAQFSKPEDLATAFHQVQDHALKEDVPLVIFDEFDTRLGNERLGWLRYFLAPMQDGLYKDGDLMYRIHRAIFVFSGGTSRSFSDFLGAGKGDAKNEFDAAKGPDFVSRLRGHLDIKPIDITGRDEIRLMFRRAILLRHFLKQNHKITDEEGVTWIDPGVVRAFLASPVTSTACVPWWRSFRWRPSSRAAISRSPPCPLGISSRCTSTLTCSSNWLVRSPRSVSY